MQDKSRLTPPKEADSHIDSPSPIFFLTNDLILLPNNLDSSGSHFSDQSAPHFSPPSNINPNPNILGPTSLQPLESNSSLFHLNHANFSNPTNLPSTSPPPIFSPPTMHTYLQSPIANPLANPPPMDSPLPIINPDLSPNFGQDQISHLIVTRS